MEKMEIVQESELETAVRHALELLLNKKKTSGASVIALHGDLGAGKTAFVKSLARELGVVEDVTSPTFVILKLYPLEEGGPFSVLAHIDAYRIEDTDEMRVIRFDELLAEPRALLCIEWAEKIKDLLPSDALQVHIEIKGEVREITFA